MICPGVDDITIDAGRVADYDALAAYHYRAGRPASVAQVWRAGPPGDPAGVLLVSHPVLNSSARDAVIGDRYRGCSRAEAARRVNRELRTISRVIIEPRRRGIGLATRLVQYALRESATRFTEAFAAMGWMHPFFERAGMTAHAPPIHAADARWHAVVARSPLTPGDLRSPAAWRNALRRLDPDVRALIEREANTWIAAQRRGGNVPAALRNARLGNRARPMYYLHDKEATDVH